MMNCTRENKVSGGDYRITCCGLGPQGEPGASGENGVPGAMVRIKDSIPVYRQNQHLCLYN